MPSLMLGMLQVAFGGSLGIVTGREGVRGRDLGRPLHAHRSARPGLSVLHPVPGRCATCRRRICWTDPMIRTTCATRWCCSGVTGLGLVDEKQTPLGLMPGVEVGAQLMESILTGNLLHRPAVLEQIEIALMIAAGPGDHLPAAVSASAHRRRAYSPPLIVALIGLEYASFRILHLLFDGVYPALGVISNLRRDAGRELARGRSGPPHGWPPTWNTNARPRPVSKASSTPRARSRWDSCRAISSAFPTAATSTSTP